MDVVEDDKEVGTEEGETLDFTGLLGLLESFARFFDSRFTVFSLTLIGSFAEDDETVAETVAETEGGSDEEMAGDLDLGCFRFDALEGSDEEMIGRSEGVSKEPVPCKGGEGVSSEGGNCVPGVSSTGSLEGVSFMDSLEGSLEGSFVSEGVSSTMEGVSSTMEGVSSTTESSNGSSRSSFKISPFSGIAQTSSFCLGRE